MAFSEDGDYIILSNGSRTIWIVDITDPGQPQYLSYVPGVPFSVSNPTVVGNYLFMSAGCNGALLIDISDKAHPFIEETLCFDGSFYVTDIEGLGAHQLMIQKNYADLDFYTLGSGNILSNIGSLTVQSSSRYCIDTSGSSTYLYVTQGTSSFLDVYDISSPGAVTLAYSYDMPFSNMNMITMEDNHLFISTLNDGVYSYYCNHGVLGGSSQYSTTAPCSELVDDNGYLYMVGGTIYGGLHFWDKIANTEIPLFYNEFYSNVTDIAISDQGIALIVCNSYTCLYIVDTAVSANQPPIVLQKLENYGSFVEYAGDDIFCVSGGSDQSFKKIRIDLEGNITEMGSCTVQNYAGDIAIDRTREVAFVSNFHTGVSKIDISGQGSPTNLGAFTQVTMVQDLCIDGNIGYISTIYDGLVIVDFTNLSYPEVKGSVGPNSGSLTKVAFGMDHFVYSISSGNKVQVFDCSNINAPVLKDEIEVGFGDSLGDIAVNKNALFITSRLDLKSQPNKALYVLDISQPDVPNLTCEFKYIKGKNDNLVVKDDYLFLLDSEALLEIVEINDE